MLYTPPNHEYYQAYSTGPMTSTKNQSIYLSIYGSIHPSIHRWIDPSIDRSIHPSIDGSIHRLIDRSIHPSIDPSIDPSTDRSIHRSIYLIYILIVFVVGWHSLCVRMSVMFTYNLGTGEVIVSKFSE